MISIPAGIIRPVIECKIVNRTFLFYLVLFNLSLNLSAQGNDFGIWAGVTGKHEFSKKLDAELFLSFRTTDKTSVLDQYFAEPGINYSINNYLSAGGSVRLINKLEDDDLYHFRQKFYLYCKGEVPAGKFYFSGRLTYQMAVKTYVENEIDPQSENFLRFKVKAGYDSKTSPLRPFISFEPFFTVFDATGNGIGKTRTSAGCDLKITRKSSVEAAFIYENFTKEGKAGKNILSVGFQKIF